MRYLVPLVSQTSSMSCWSASIAMILGWKNQASYSDRLLAANSGGVNYMPAFNNGLNPNDHYILERYGFQIAPSASYTRAGIHQMMKEHGPLWVATLAPAPHVRVVTGYQGGVFHINDPSPVNRGSVYTRSFRRFFGAMENLARTELSQPNPVYIAHLR